MGRELAEQLRIAGNFQTVNDAFDDFVQYNGPELSTAFFKNADFSIFEGTHLRVSRNNMNRRPVPDWLSGVVLEYVGCLARPFCKFVPRGLRTAEGLASVAPLFAEFMDPNTGRFLGFAEWSGTKQVFLDSFSHAQGFSLEDSHVRVIINDNQVPILISELHGRFHLLPHSRMILQVTLTNEIHVWHSNSFKPVIFRPPVVDGRLGVRVHLVLSPDRQQFITRTDVDVDDVNRSRTFHLWDTHYQATPDPLAHGSTAFETAE